MKLEYLNKRDLKNRLLTFSGYELTSDLTASAIDFLEKSEVINIASKSIPKKFILLYFKKMIFGQIRPICSQIVISNWLKKNKNIYNSYIDTSNFICIHFLQNILKNNNLNFKLKKNYYSIFKEQIKILKPIYRAKKNFFNYVKLKENPKNLKKANIAVNYSDGIEKHKRSDLFFLNQDALDRSTIFLYFEYPELLSKHVNKKELFQLIDEYGIKYIKLWDWVPNIEKNIFKDFDFEIDKKFIKDPTEKWVLKEIKNLFYHIKYWYAFFKEHNIKINIDPSEHGQTTIIKQIALKLLDACSVGKTRSYPTTQKGVFDNYYANDIFFTWGLDSAKRIDKTSNKVDNIIISGFPYITNRQNNLLSNSIQKQFQNSNIKLRILLLDNVHSDEKTSNRSLHKHNRLAQVIETKELEKFYSSFFNWLLEDKEIGLIIKSKRNTIINSLPNLNNKLQEVIETNRCHIVKKPFQILPSALTDVCNFAVSINTFFPSSLVECIIKNKRAVFYDYSGVFEDEQNIKSWGIEKVIFRNIEQIINSMKKFKKNPELFSSIGNWSNFMKEFDPFNDDLGGKRIGEYLKFLQENFNKKFSGKKSIFLANESYQKKWGENLLYKKNKNFFTNKN